MNRHDGERRSLAVFFIVYLSLIASILGQNASLASNKLSAEKTKLGESPPEETQVIYVPHFANGDFGDNSIGSYLTIKIEGLDPESPSPTVLVESFDDTGEPLDILQKGGLLLPGVRPTSRRSLTFDVGATRFVFSQTGAIPRFGPGNSPLRQGWVRITAPAGLDINVESTFNITFLPEQGSRELRTWANVPGVTPRTEWGSLAHTVQRPSTGQVTESTGLAMVNPDPDNAALVTIEPVNSTGTPIGLPIELLVPAGGRVVDFLHELSPGLRDFWGKVKISSDLPIVTLPLLQEGLVLTTLKTF